MLTARDEDVDKIIGLEVGADDYLTKPFNPRELVARIKSILRRSTPERRDRESEVIVHGDLRVDAGRREARVGDEEIQLAPKEFDLLWELLDHRGLVLTRDQLLERVWGYTFAGDTRTVDVHVRQLRRKLGDASPIVTVWGVGYKVSPARDAAEGPGDRLGKAARVFSSLRVRLPLLFLAGILLSGLVTTLIAIRLFQDFAHDQTLSELRREANGHRAALLERGQRRRSTRRTGRRAGRRRSPRANLERATGDRIYFTAACSPFPGEQSGLRPLASDDDRLDVGRDADVRVHAAGPRAARTSRSPHPVALGKTPIGAIVVAKQKTDVDQPRAARSSGGSRSRARSACSSPALLAWYLSRRDRPAGARALARRRRGRGGQLRRRDARERRPARSATSPSGSSEMTDAARRGRGARAELPHVGLARAADAADRDPRPRRGAARGRGRGPGAAHALARGRRGGGAAARAARRRHPRPREARRAPLHGAARGGRHGAARRAGLRDVQRARRGGARSTTASTSARSR